jgi:hypothetical protein
MLVSATLFCFNTTQEGEFFLAQPALLQAAILAEDDCGCEHSKKRPRNGTAKQGMPEENKHKEYRLLEVDHGK